MKAIRRGATVPGGYCGLYGSDAAAIATGIALSVILKATPLTDYERRTANMMTSRALAAIAASSALMLTAGILRARDHLKTGIEKVK